MLQGWFEMMDLSIPIIAQVHGYCLAGGTELATACDLVYVADDAEIGYPPVRSMSSPDMGWHVWMMGMRRAMEAMLTGDSMSGVEAVDAGFANRSFPAEDLDAAVLAVAERVAKVPSDLQALNKRVVHRAMEAMGMRNGMRATADINAIGFHQPSSIEYHRRFSYGGTSALTSRDETFGDYRTAEEKDIAWSRDRCGNLKATGSEVEVGDEERILVVDPHVECGGSEICDFGRALVLGADVGAVGLVT